jgi:hypothetical protein
VEDFGVTLTIFVSEENKSSEMLGGIEDLLYF